MFFLDDLRDPKRAREGLFPNYDKKAGISHCIGVEKRIAIACESTTLRISGL